MLRSIFTIFILLSIQICCAQVKIGPNAAVVNPAAVLELSNDPPHSPNTWKSFLPPQVNFSNAVFL